MSDLIEIDINAAEDIQELEKARETGCRWIPKRTPRWTPKWTEDESPPKLTKEIVLNVTTLVRPKPYRYDLFINFAFLSSF